MALAQYNYPQPTGLQQLGDVLLRGSGDYANIQLQRQAEERRRAQQLADLQDQRRFAIEQRGVERALALEDERRKRGQAVDDITYQLLLKEGYLKATDATNPQAIANAAAKRQTDLDKRRTQEQEAVVNAQAEVNRLSQDRENLSVRDQELQKRLRELQDQYAETAQMAEPVPVTRAAVEMRAAELARAAGVKVSPQEPKRSEQLSLYLGQAEEDLVKESFGPALLAQNRLKSISNQYNSLVREQSAVNDQIRTIRQTLADLQRQFPVAPVRAQTPAETLQMTPSAAVEPAPIAPSVATAEEREAARRAASRRVEPATLPEPSQSDLAPAYSIKGIGQRLPQLIPELLAVPGRAIDTGSRYAAAGLRGLWEGDFTVPAQGPVALAGQEIGRRLAPAIEPGDYMSAERAKLLGLRRSLDPLPPINPPLTPGPQESLRSSAFYR